MTLAADPTLVALPSDLPPVERVARLPGGFAAGGTTAGIKASGRPDLALVVATDGPAAAAAVFTPNRVAAAPVRRSEANLRATDPDGAGRSGWARAVISTSGSANAATGAAGDEDQARIGRLVADAVGATEAEILHLSTGIIGTRLPLEKIAAGVAALEPALGREDDALLAAAVALRTTDSVTKVASTVIELPVRGGGAARVTVAGIAKGVGMIHPRMATMLSVILTDARAEPAQLRAILGPVAARTWNQLTVDGDTSTNDTVFLLASGASGGEALDDAATATLRRGVESVARDLARQQAADGEGATTLITCQVSGARDDVDARAVARAVVASSLVKAAIHGRDPNWGRIAGAAGNAAAAETAVLVAAGTDVAAARERGGSPVTLDPARLRIAIAGHLVYDGAAGGPLPFDRDAARTAMDASETLIRLDLGVGGATGEAFGCDLTETYVRENSEYTT